MINDSVDSSYTLINYLNSLNPLVIVGFFLVMGLILFIILWKFMKDDWEVDEDGVKVPTV